MRRNLPQLAILPRTSSNTWQNRCVCYCPLSSGALEQLFLDCRCNYGAFRTGGAGCDRVVEYEVRDTAFVLFLYACHFSARLVLFIMLLFSLDDSEQILTCLCSINAEVLVRQLENAGAPSEGRLICYLLMLCSSCRAYWQGPCAGLGIIAKLRPFSWFSWHLFELLTGGPNCRTYGGLQSSRSRRCPGGPNAS